MFTEETIEFLSLDFSLPKIKPEITLNCMYNNSYCFTLITCGDWTNNACHDVNATPKIKLEAAKMGYFQEHFFHIWNAGTCHISTYLYYPHNIHVGLAVNSTDALIKTSTCGLNRSELKRTYNHTVLCHPSSSISSDWTLVCQFCGIFCRKCQ